MEMFNEGGLKDEGGSVDPVSGNDVPIGSTKEEVRDDIPAMVSEGEFVFPADVVRYIGLNNLMNMRQEAKMGLKTMEAMGQMGNGDEATLPDDMPFGMADIVIVEDSDEPKEMAQGGVIQAQTGKFITPMFNPSDQDNREYRNAQGESLFIPFLNGEPVYPIPAGYSPVGQAPTEAEVEATPVSDNDDDPRPPPEPSEFQKAGGWDMDFKNPDGSINAEKVELWVKESEKVSTFGNVATGIMAAINPLIGMASHLGNQANKKGIAANFERAMAAAGKTPIEGQIDRLKEVNTRLTTKEGKNILSQALNSVIDDFGNIFKSEDERNAAKLEAGNAVATGPKLTPEEIEKRRKIAESILKTSTDAFEAERISNLLASEEEAKIAGSTLKEDGTYDISSWFKPSVETQTDDKKIIPVRDIAPLEELATAPKADEEGDGVALAEQMAQDGFDYRATDYNKLDTYAARENYLNRGGRRYEEKEGLLNQPKPEQVPAYYSDAATQLRQTIESMRNASKVEPAKVTSAVQAVTDTIDQTQTSNLRGRNKGRNNTRSIEKQTDEVLESGPVTTDTTSAGVIADKPSSVTAMRTKRKKDRKKKRQSIIDRKDQIKKTAEKFKEQGLVKKGMTPIQTVAKTQEQMSKPKEDPDANDPRRGMMKSGGLASRK